MKEIVGFVIRALLGSFLMAGCVLVAYMVIRGDVHKYDFSDTTTYVVEQGDSLWQIAKQYAAPRQDIREVMYIIRDLNFLERDIWPNDVLEVPIFDSLANAEK